MISSHFKFENKWAFSQLLEWYSITVIFLKFKISSIVCCLFYIFCIWIKRSKWKFISQMRIWLVLRISKRFIEFILSLILILLNCSLAGTINIFVQFYYIFFKNKLGQKKKSFNATIHIYVLACQFLRPSNEHKDVMLQSNDTNDRKTRPIAETIAMRERRQLLRCLTWAG